MQAFIVLCDSAQRDQATGKMHMLGADWSLADSSTPPMTVAVFLRVPWEQATSTRPFTLRLVDDENKPVIAVLDGESFPVEHRGEFSITQEPSSDDFIRMTDIHSSFAVNVAPFQLKAGRRYEWKLDVEGRELACVDFAIRPILPAEEPV